MSAVDGTEPVPPKPNLRFGVMSDVHIGGKKDAEATAEKVLRWFASENVDAVLCPGDMNELPRDRPIRFTVTPRDCFGLAGKPLAAVREIGGSKG